MAPFYIHGTGSPTKPAPQYTTPTPFPSVETDPHWASVVFLQNFQGANGSKPATDQSQYAHALTWSGNAEISTAQSPFAGGSSAAFDGSGDYISSPDSEAFYLPGDFTIEFWIRHVSGSPVYLLGQYQTADFTPVLVGIIGSLFRVAISSNNSSWALEGSGHTVSANTWDHISMVRSGSAFTIYKNGAGTSVGSSAAVPYNSTGALRIGAGYGSGIYPLNGQIGPIRITKGIARYTTNFTPPTAPFPTGL